MGIAVLGSLTCDGTATFGRRDRAVLTALAMYPGRPISADQLAGLCAPIGRSRHHGMGDRLLTRWVADRHTGLDGSVSLWHGTTGESLGSILLPEKVTSAAGFGEDGETVVIATATGGVYHWDTGVGHALDHACRLAGRDFTKAEWEQTFGSRPYRETCPAPVTPGE